MNTLKYLLYGICVSSIFLGCNRDDEDVSPSFADQNWFSIPNKPGTFNQLAYQIYIETGIPLFVNDTLGTEYYATDAEGNPLIRTETFNIGYTLFGNLELGSGEVSTDRYIVLSADTASMVKAGTLIRNKVIPYLPKTGEFCPKCYLLVDSLNDSYTGSYGFDSYKFKLANTTAYGALKGVVVGQLCDIQEMSEDECNLWIGKVLAAKISDWVINTKTEEIDTWYDITDEGSTRSYYGQLYKEGINNEYSQDMLEQAGMFGWYAQTVNPETGQKIRASYTQEADIIEFIACVFAYKNNEQKFLTQYESYDKIIRKFKLMQEFIRDYEEEFQISGE